MFKKDPSSILGPGVHLFNSIMGELFYNAREVSLATAKEVINYANELYEYLVQDITNDKKDKSS